MLFFFKKVIWFTAPLGLLFLFPVTVMYLGREYMSFDTVVKTQELHSDTLFSYAYNTAPYILYKQKLIEKNNPVVIALGTSRILEIRKEFFIHPEQFINAGCPCSAKTLDDISFFVDFIQPQSSAKVLIIGLDQEMFYKKNASSIESGYSALYTPMYSTALMLRSMYLDYIAYKYSLRELYTRSKETNNIGLAAIVHNNGFRADGSYLYGETQKNTNRIKDIDLQLEKEVYTISNTQHTITEDQKKYLVNNLNKLNSIIELAKNKGVIVILFMQPYPERIYKAKMDAYGTANDLVTTVPDLVSSIASSHHVAFFDLSSPKFFGGKDTEFVDSLHGTDVMYLRIMIYISERVKELRPYVNTLTLKGILQKTQGDFFTF